MLSLWLKSKKISAILKIANELYRQKRFDSAIKCYRRILKIDPTHFAAQANLATAFFECENFVDSIPELKQVIKIDSINPWWYNYLSQAYQKTGDYTLALDVGLQAVILSNGDDNHHLNMAYTIYEISDVKGVDFIDPYLQKWSEKYPDNAVVKQCYKSFYFDKNFTRSEPGYVEKLFDVFAADFDEVLSALEYDSPSILAQKIAQFCSDQKQVKIRILDLGCGSGLCGENIKKNIPNSHLIGVDISSKMLQIAALKKVYNKFIKSDITNCFDDINCCVDVVVASDVFTYFGDLDSLFKSINDTLSDDGVFAFTISSNNVNNEDYFLMPSSRFVHNIKYIEKVLKKHQFSIIENEEKILRKEGEKDVIGRVILAVKS